MLIYEMGSITSATFISKTDWEKEGDVEEFHQWHWRESEVVLTASWFPLLERVGRNPGTGAGRVPLYPAPCFPLGFPELWSWVRSDLDAPPKLRSEPKGA